MSVSARTVTARRDRLCGNYPSCPNDGIKAGDDYARHVAFPGDDANQSNRPLTLDLCQPCHTEYERPMPPRRARRRKASR